jgi:hypothetical protein
MNTNTNTNTNNNININDNDNIFSDAGDLISKSISDTGNVIANTSNDLIENTTSAINDAGDVIANTSSDLIENTTSAINDAGDVITKSANDFVENTANILSPGSEIKDTTPGIDNASESLFNSDTKTTSPSLNSGNVLEMVVNYLRENGIYILLIIFTFLFLMSIFSILGINTEKKNSIKNDDKQKDGDDSGYDNDDVNNSKYNNYSKIVTVEGFKSDVDYKYYISKKI